MAYKPELWAEAKKKCRLLSIIFSHNNSQAVAIFFNLFIINCLKLFNTAAEGNQPKQRCFLRKNSLIA